MSNLAAQGNGKKADPASLDGRLRAFVGTGGDRFVPARDRVTFEGIRKMTDFAGDRSPCYSDPEFAAKSVHGHVVAPPVCGVMAYWLNGFEPVVSADWIDAQGIRRFRLDPLPARGKASPGNGDALDQVPAVLADAGYTSVVAVGGEISFMRYLRVGDQLFYSDAKVESIAGPKRTAAGEGYFTIFRITIKDRSDEVVAVMQQTLYYFIPVAPDTRPTSPSGKAAAENVKPILRPVSGSVAPLKAGDIAVGDELPSLIIEVTPSLIIAGGLFSHDTMDVHHDRDLAKKRGFKDIFMNTMTTLGLVTRFINDWAGPEAVVEHVTWRLGVQQYPYDDLHLTGKVTAIEAGHHRGPVTVAVVGSNSLGIHIACTLRLSLPA